VKESFILLYIRFITVTLGDLVSPGMFEDYLTTMNTVGAYLGAGEGYFYEFAVNLQTLNYLQTINLLDETKIAVTLEYMQTSILTVALPVVHLHIIIISVCSFIHIKVKQHGKTRKKHKAYNCTQIRHTTICNNLIFPVCCRHKTFRPYVQI